MGCENYLVACARENLQIRESTGRAAVLIGLRYLLVDYQDPPTHGGNLSFTMLPANVTALCTKTCLIFAEIGFRSRCPLLAQSGHRLVHCTCPLLGVKRTCLFAPQMSAFDPKRTLAAHRGNGFDAGFIPYQTSRLNRYDVVSRAWGGHAATRVHRALRRCGGRLAARCTASGQGPDFQNLSPRHAHTHSADGRQRCPGRDSDQSDGSAWLRAGAEPRLRSARFGGQDRNSCRD